SNVALGVYNSFTQAATAINGLYRYWNMEFYAQDTWKVTPRLTLDYGMRTAWVQPQWESSLQAATFVLSKWDPTKAPRLFQAVARAQCPATILAAADARCGF